MANAGVRVVMLLLCAGVGTAALYGDAPMAKAKARAIIRRLQQGDTGGASPAAGLPEACKKVCSGAAAVDSEMQKVQNTTAEKYGSSGADGTKLDYQKMTYMMEDMTEKTFELMCKHQDVFSCVGQHPTECSESGEGGMSMGPNPMSMAKEMGCMCSVCPKAVKAYVKMSVSTVMVLMEALMSAFSGTGLSDNSTGPSKEDNATLAAMENKIMQGMCPMIGAMECLKAHPTECKATIEEFAGSNDSNSESFSSSMTGPMLSGDLTEAKKTCTDKGISTDPGSVKLGDPALTVGTTNAPASYAIVSSSWTSLRLNSLTLVAAAVAAHICIV